MSVERSEREFDQEQFNKLMQCPESERLRIEKRGGRLWFNKWQYKLLKLCATDFVGIMQWNKWREQNRTDILLGGAELNGAFLMRADLRKVFLEGAKLQGAFLWEAKLQRTNLRESLLQGADFQRTHLEGVEFGGAKLQGVDFSRAIVDGETLIWRCEVDRDTKFEGVGLGTARIYPKTKQLLECNIRRMNWEEWYKWKDWFNYNPEKERKKLGQFFLRNTIGWFWEISDYGISTWRIIKIFFQLAFIFAAVYLGWGLIDYHLLGVKDNPGIVSNLFVLESEKEAVSPCLVPFRSFYFSIVTMTTLGFGDMYANTHSFLRGLFGHILLVLQVILGYAFLAALVTRFAVLFTAGGPAGKFTPMDEETKELLKNLEKEKKK